METWVVLPHPWVSIHPFEIWHSHPCPSRPLHPGANTVNLSWLPCHLSRFPHIVAKLGIWPSVFFKPCDPDVEIKKELCYRIKQIQEALAVSASNTLKLQQEDQHGNSKNSLWERGKTQRKVMANPCFGLQKPATLPGCQSRHRGYGVLFAIASWYRTRSRY